MALSAYNSGEIFIPSWVYNQASVFTIATSALTESTVFSGQAEFGYSSIGSDGASGVWFGPISGPLIHYGASGGVTTYPYGPSGIISLGNVLSVSGASFAADEAGNVYVVSGSGMALVNTFPSEPVRELVSALGKVWGLLPAVSGVGSVLAGSPYTSGVATVPMQHITSIAGSSGYLAVGGWNPANIPSGFSAFALDPLGSVSGILAAASIADSSVSLWTSNNLGRWTLNQTVSGLGSPAFLAWGSVGTTLFASDTVNNSLYVLSYIFGTLALTQTISISGVGAIAFTTDALHALACQPGLNQVTPLSIVGSGWVSGTPFSLPTPQSVLALSTVDAIVGNASGLTDVTLNASGVWNVNATTSLPFNPTVVVPSRIGGVAAGGTAGPSGYIYDNGVVGSFTGSVDGFLFYRDQYVAADNTNSLLRTFQLIGGAFTQKSTNTAPAGVGALALASISLLVAGTSLTPLFRFAAPWTLRTEVSGQVSAYDGASWTNTQLLIDQQPEAITFDVSGNITVVTLQNQLITVLNPGGGLLPVSGVVDIPVFAGQVSGTPIGWSEIAWIDGHLYSTSSLNETFVKIL